MSLAVQLDAITLRQWTGRSQTLVRDVVLDIPDGTTLGIVGESGSGKSLTALALMGLLPAGMRASGRILLDGTDLLQLPATAMRRVRGARMGMIFQEPMTALNPSMRIGAQIAEGLLAHRHISRSEAQREALRLLERVQLPRARARINDYPHQLSGGQRQRVGIAIALAPGPKLLIADEPTTALDVLVQAEVLQLLGGLIRDLHMSLLLISHDLGVIASICEQTLVMRDGAPVESGPTGQVLRKPRAPYTRELIAAVPRRDESRVAPGQDGSEAPVLAVRNLVREYRTGTGRLLARAVDDVSFDVGRGEIFGIVGESGCGKSTLSRVIMALDKPTSGQVLFEGTDLFAVPPRALQRLRTGFQMIFQDPRGSLNPRHRVARIITEPLHLDRNAPRGSALDDMVVQALTDVGLSPDDARKLPHQFSGGQRQRIAIARALICRPRLVIADEPTSALDLPVQGQILDLLRSLRDRYGVAFLFISHSLAVVEAIADRVSVMYRGRFVETGAPAQVLRAPEHAYSKQLIGAELRADQPRRYGVAQALPSHS
ncbi:MAG: ABC transporter ATP-binding protein [Ottowia sp.]|nr:ABC transporter ATP-binding protein [Ottowia sp.]